MQERENTKALEVSDLSVCRRNRQILSEVSFNAGFGEVIGLIGANGSGKSTLLKSVLGILPWKSGRCSVNGVAVEPENRSWLSRNVGYLAQDTTCHWPLEVERVVALGRLPHLPSACVPGAADREAIRQAMLVAGIGHLAKRTLTRLSGGEQRRVHLARMLAVEPRVLLADEPIAGLDPFHQLAIMELFCSQAEAGRLVVVVLHDLTLATRFCDRLILLKEGRVLADGLPDAVLSGAHLAEAYRIEARVFNDREHRALIPWDCIHED